MNHKFSKSQIALAVAAAIGATAIAAAPGIANAAKTAGKYVAGDFHNHTTCSDGSISMEKLVKKVTDKVETPWAWTGSCRLATAATATAIARLRKTPRWTRRCIRSMQRFRRARIRPGENSGVTPKGLSNGTSPNKNMWRWQSIQEFQYPLIEYFNAFKNLPLFIGIESVVAGHEHSSMSVITGQIPPALDAAVLPTSPGRSPRPTPRSEAATRWPSGNTASTAATPTPAAATRPSAPFPSSAATTGTARSPAARTAAT